MEAIHWYPGHMKRATNEMVDVLRNVDVVVELVDARAPISSRNPLFKNITKNKPHILVYMKSDLADLSRLHVEDNAILVSIKDKQSINNLINKISDANKEKRLKDLKRGIKSDLVKAMIVGIPNIGKSSLINALNNHKVTKVENKPGLTKKNRWVNVKNRFYLLDTPGILPTNFKTNNYPLALIGAIKNEILPTYDLSEFAYRYIIKNYKDLYLKRYKEIKNTSNDSFRYIEEIRGIKNDKSLTYDKARELFLKEIRDAKLGRLYFD